MMNTGNGMNIKKQNWFDHYIHQREDGQWVCLDETMNEFAVVKDHTTAISAMLWYARHLEDDCMDELVSELFK